MQVDVIILLEHGVVKETHIVENETTAEAVFDDIMERLLEPDQFEEINESVDYGYKLDKFNDFIGYLGQQLIWSERVDVNTFNGDSDE